MTAFTLNYFDIPGGRGEPIRLAFHLAGISFTDKRFAFEDFPQYQQASAFKTTPTLEVDGQIITQSNAMLRFIGKQSDLYPSDPLQALYCDEVLDALEDMTHMLVQTMHLQGDAQKQAREQLMEGKLKNYLLGLAELLERGGGETFCNTGLSIADIKAFIQTRSLKSGKIDHMPADFIDSVAPSLVAHQQRLEADAQVQSYYQR